MQKSDNLAKVLFVHRQKYQCEKLYANDHVMNAAQILLEVVRVLDGSVEADNIIVDWLSCGFPRVR